MSSRGVARSAHDRNVARLIARITLHTLFSRMAPRRYRVVSLYWSTLVVALLLCLGSVSVSALSVRTTIPSVQSSGTFKSIGANASIVTGPIQTTPALFLGNKLYVQVPQAMVAMDLSQNSSADMISSSMARAYPSMPTLAAAIDDPLVRSPPAKGRATSLFLCCFSCPQVPRLLKMDINFMICINFCTGLFSFGSIMVISPNSRREPQTHVTCGLVAGRLFGPFWGENFISHLFVNFSSHCHYFCRFLDVLLYYLILHAVWRT